MIGAEARISLEGDGRHFAKPPAARELGSHRAMAMERSTIFHR